MGKIINTSLLGDWQNWLRILLMVAIGGAMLHFAQQLFSTKTKDN
jgi:hypothetical protein